MLKRHCSYFSSFWLFLLLNTVQYQTRSCACTESFNLFTAIVSSWLRVKDVLEFKVHIITTQFSIIIHLHCVILHDSSCQWNIGESFIKTNRILAMTNKTFWLLMLRKFYTCYDLRALFLTKKGNENDA